MRKLSFLLTLLCGFLPVHGAAGPTVVELYTSQGCVSCPPADALLGELADREDVIALSFSVSYWDYIGWKDTFAQPAFSSRQKAYFDRIGARSKFTPHMVVGGVDQIRGAKPMLLGELLQKHSMRQYPVQMVPAADENGDLLVTVTADIPFKMSPDLLLIGYTDAETVNISRGENKGRSITYRHIVRTLQKLDVETRSAGITLPEPLASDYYEVIPGSEYLQVRPPDLETGLRYVLLAQAMGNGRILGALRLN